MNYEMSTFDIFRFKFVLNYTSLKEFNEQQCSTTQPDYYKSYREVALKKPRRAQLYYDTFC